MAGRVRAFMAPKPRHRRDRRAYTAAYLPGEAGFVPRHCAGETCMHNHPGEDLPTFAGWAS